MPTIIAPLTPIQLAPVITLRVSGPQSLALLAFFDLKKLEPRIATRARFSSRLNTKIRDEVLLLYFKAPASYTGEDVLEVSFHGNPLIANQALADFAALGLRMAEAGEFTRRALVNGKLSLSQAEAVNALIHAPTASGVASAQHTLHGELDAIFTELRTELVAVLAHLEATIDFAEELGDNELSVEAALRAPCERLTALVNRYKDVQQAVKGVQVVIAGAPNAGKSTLFNLLLGSERAIVADEAGTTRDLITEQLHIGSAQIRLTDTAGIRQTNSKAEAEGVRRAQSALDNADLILIMVDLSAPLPEETAFLLDKHKTHAIVIGTKADLARCVAIDVTITVSTKDSASIKELRELLGKAVAQLIPQNDLGPALLADTQQQDCLRCLVELNEINDTLSIDIQAYHLRQAIAALDRTQGRELTEQTLDRLFATFCIGK